MNDILHRILAVVISRFVGESKDKARENCEGCAEEWASQLDHACMDYGHQKDEEDYLDMYGNEARHSINHLAVVGMFYQCIREEGLNVGNFESDPRHDVHLILHRWFSEAAGAPYEELTYWLQRDDPEIDGMVFSYDLDHYRLIYTLD